MNLKSIYMVFYLLSCYFVESSVPEQQHQHEATKTGEEKTTGDDREQAGQNSEFKTPEDKKLPRFLTFNNDVSNIRIEITFTVPFLLIPIGGKDSHGGTTLLPIPDVNLKSVFAAGALFFMLFLVIPKLVKLYLPPTPAKARLARVNRQNDLSRLLKTVDEALHEHNIDSTACSQKLICYAVTNAAERVAHGQGSSLDKIVDGVLGIPWLRNLIRVDPIREALMLSSQGNNCQIYHSRCPVTKGRLYGAAGSLLDAINRSKHH